MLIKIMKVKTKIVVKITKLNKKIKKNINQNFCNKS